MAVQLTRRQFTVAEYYEMGKAGILTEDDRVELIEGEIIEMSPIGDAHAWCVNRLNRLFSKAVGDVAVVSVQNPVRLGDRSEPVPDVMLVRLGPGLRGPHPTPADVLLLVEVSDTTLAYDEQVKVPLYARSGVPETWIVDLNREAIRAHREPTPKGYRLIEVHQRGDRISPSAFPDLSLGVDDILG